MSKFRICGTWIQNDLNKKMINADSVKAFDIQPVSKHVNTEYEVIVEYKNGSDHDVIYRGTEEDCDKVMESLWAQFDGEYNLLGHAMQSMVDLSGLIWRLINILNPNEQEEQDGEE